MSVRHPTEGVSEGEAMKGGRWINADDVGTLARRMAVALNGADAAPRPQLVDVVHQVEALAKAQGRLLKLVREFDDRAEAFEAIKSFVPSAQGSAARGSAGAYRECARLLRVALSARA